MRREAFINPLAYTVFPVQLPKLSRKEREAAIQNRIASWYPGYCDDTTLITLKNGGAGCCLMVVLREPLPGNPLCLSTLAAVQLCKNATVVLASTDFLEYVQVADGVVLSRAVCAADTEIVDYFDTKGPIEVYCPKKDIPLSPGNELVHYHSLEEALTGLREETVACYPGLLPQVRRRRLVAAVASILLTVLCGIEAFRFAEKAHEKRQAERIALEQQASYERQKEAAAQYLRELEIQVAALDEQRTATIYESLAILASCLTPDIRVASATLREGTFQLDAYSGDALGALRALERHPRIRECVMQTIVWENGQEHFTIKGHITTRARVPEQSTDTAVLIAFYEDVLTSYQREMKNQPVENAAAAGEVVRRLLEENGCFINRFRYLDAPGGWTIDCSFETSSYALVRMVQKANDPSFPLSLQSLQTRSRYPGNGIEANGTFFAPVAALEKEKETGQPSIAQIASLYANGRASPPVPQPVSFSGGMMSTTRSEPEPVLSSVPGPSEYVGFVELNGTRYTYVKDKNTGEVRRAHEN